MKDRSPEPRVGISPLRRLRLLARKAGLDVRRYPDLTDSSYRLSLLLRQWKIGALLDVGAYVGDFGQAARSFGYTGLIVSCEPQSYAYEMLKRRTDQDPGWIAKNIALGSSEGRGTMNISRNRYSSSLLTMGDRHLAADASAEVVGTESVSITTLNALVAEIGLSAEDRIFLKIDVQGYEEDVLLGATDVLGRIVGVQIECNLRPVYERGLMLPNALEVFTREGFELAAIEPGFSDKSSGETLQVDCIFFRGDEG